MSNNNNHYFTKENENAVIAYAHSNSREERTQLYEKFIEKPFSEMVDKIIFTYKFNNLSDIALLREECKVFLITLLDKFEPEKGYKAFSYFSVITKNWFIHKVKKQALQNKREITYEDLTKEVSSQLYDKKGNVYVEERESCEFWNNLKGEMNKWEEESCKDSEKRVIKAIEILLNNINDIEIFNKKAFYLYLRELTGLNTKQIVSHLNRIKHKYKSFKVKWNDEVV